MTCIKIVLNIFSCNCCPERLPGNFLPELGRLLKDMYQCCCCCDNKQNPQSIGSATQRKTEKTTHTVETDGPKRVEKKTWKWTEEQQIDIHNLQGAKSYTEHFKFDSNELLPGTNYAANLMYKPQPNSQALDAQINASVVINGQPQQTKAVRLSPTVDPHRSYDTTVGLPVQRSDGWMQLELGQFSVDDITGDNEVTVTLDSDNQCENSGLIVARMAIVPVLLAARTLKIARSDNSQNWTWHAPEQDSRFKEVAELQQVRRLKMEGKVSLDYLPPGTYYVAYLIFKIASSSKGLNKSQVATLSTDNFKAKKMVCVNPTDLTSDEERSRVGVPIDRSDGWMELELGRIYCDQLNGCAELAMSLKDTNKGYIKSGLIVAGIEVRSF